MTKTGQEIPFVSAVIACRNEEGYIRSCLDSVIANDYPKDRLEVLVIDGMSEDRTREIAERYVRQYAFIRPLDNPKKITPVAFNIGIQHAKGEIIIIMGAHTTYEKDYISKCVKNLSKLGADNIGGILKAVPRDNTLVGRAIILSQSHPFGVGNSRFRTGSKKPVSVDTVYGGCYRKEVFDEIGLFNEELVRSQDIDFNTRLKHRGGKILLVPEIVSYYYVRSDFKEFCRHRFLDGIWAIYPMKFVSYMPVSWRHMVPLAFLSSLIGWAALSVFSQIFLWLLLLTFGSYTLMNVYSSIKISAREKDFKYLLVMPLIFAALHISYGLGSLWGLLKVVTSIRFWKNRFRSFSKMFKTRRVEHGKDREREEGKREGIA